MASEWDVVSHEPVDEWAVVNHAPTGPQPGIMDRIVGSPVGRFAHDAIVQPISGAVGMLPRLLHELPGVGVGMDAANAIAPMLAPKGQATQVQDIPAQALNSVVEQPYQGALARNRNTPGYAQARQQAVAIRARDGGAGLTDQLAAPFNPALAGITGGLFGGSLDAMNAASDSQTASQEGYAAKHPIMSTMAGLTGGLAMGAPELSPGRSASRLLPMPTKTPNDAALSYVERLMGSSKTAPDAAGLRAAQTGASGKPITSAEAIGKPGEVALGALARREGQTADALGGMAKARTAMAPARIMDDYAAASGIHPAAARGDIEAFVESNQKAASPLYEEAYKQNQSIASPMLDRILETPAGKKALADARVKMQNDMSLMGTPDADLMEQAAEGGTSLPARGAASGMKLRVYDYVKRSLDDQIDSAFRAGNKNEGSIIRDLKSNLVKELDKADVTAAAGPNSVKLEGGAYARARAKAGEYLSAKKQYELGQTHILDDKFPAKDFADHLTKLGDADRQAYMGGAANKLFNLQQSGKLKADIFKSPGIRQKLGAAMGQAKADAFIRNMETEQSMAEFVRLRAPGAGSPTEVYRQAMKDQDGMSAHAADLMQMGGDAIQHGPMRAITNLAVGKSKDALASYLTRGMAVPVRDEAGKLLMLPPEELANIFAQRPAAAAPPSQFQLPMGRLSQSALPLGLFGASGQFNRQ